MLVDLRTYTLNPGKMRDFLEKYEAKGLPLHRKFVGEPIGYFTTEVGTLNQVVHMWGYESLADREIKRSRMEANVEWISYLDWMNSHNHIMHQEIKILKSTRFSKI